MRLLPLVLLVACSTHQNGLTMRGAAFDTTQLQVAKPVFLMDHLEGDPFRTNSAVGNLTFSGGFISDGDGTGLHNVSKQVDLQETAPYRQQIEAWFADHLPGSVVIETPTPPQRRERRGTDRRDGSDNVSLPRLDLVPEAQTPLAAPTLVPWVVSYTSHNGGWFYGQTWGTGAGARMRVLLAAHDADGSVRGFVDLDGSRISEDLFSPTQGQLQDLLLVLERRMAKRMRRFTPQ